MKPRPRRRNQHAASGVQFKDARRDAGLSRAQACRLLHVTQRTIRNWEIPDAKVPWLAYEIMRIHGCHELPGEAWRGWRVVGDKLYSPERLAFAAHEASWWSLTCAMAREWRRAQEEGSRLLRSAAQPASAESALPKKAHSRDLAEAEA